EIQPKGLLATEGCVSFPLLDRPAPVLAVRSHFFEFVESERDTTAGGHAVARLAHELDPGGRYRVVITTGGGLYWYCLNDEVEGVGCETGSPFLGFLARWDGARARGGEKLRDPHVGPVLARFFAAPGLARAFALLAPITSPPPPYRLSLQGPPQQLDPIP